MGDIHVDICSTQFAKQGHTELTAFVKQFDEQLGTKGALASFYVLPNFRLPATAATPAPIAGSLIGGGGASETASTRAALARGFVAEIDSNAPAASIADYLDALGGRISVVPLTRATLTSQSMRAWQDRAQRAYIAALLQDDNNVVRSAPYSLETGNSQTWALDLGARSHFSGIFASMDLQSRMGDGALVTHTGADAQVEQLRAFVSQQPVTYTIGDLMESKRYQDLQAYADTNNRAVSARVAELLDLPIRVEDDLEEASTGVYHQPRPLVIGHSMARYGSISRARHGGRGRRHNKKPKEVDEEKRVGGDDSLVRLHNRTISLELSDGASIALPLDPLSGVAHYRFVDNVAAGANQISLLQNKCCNSLPLGAPTLPRNALIGDSVAAEPLTNHQQEEVMRRLWWQGKQSGTGLASVYARIARASDPDFVSNPKIAHGLGLDSPQLQRSFMQPVVVLVSGN